MCLNFSLNNAFTHRDRKVGDKLYRGYSIGTGAIYAKYLFKQPKLCLPFYWDIKKSIKEMVSCSNLFYPIIDFSFKHKVAYTVLGAMKYFLVSQRARRWPIL